MFTGIIEGVGTVRTVKKKEEGLEIEIGCEFDLERTNVGDSISVNGCCLTVTSRLGKSFWADVSDESTGITTLGNVKVGDPVNLERALQVGSRLAGHIVQGHVDGIGQIVDIKEHSGSMEYRIEIPAQLST
jgi:riboflavin synthase